MVTKKQLYISIPMTGCLETSAIREKEARIKLQEKYPDYTIVSGYDIIDGKEHNVSYYMGRDIENLLESDVVVLMSGWENSKGCQVERYAAQIYGIKIVNYDDLFTK